MPSLQHTLQSQLNAFFNPRAKPRPSRPAQPRPLFAVFSDGTETKVRKHRREGFTFVGPDGVSHANTMLRDLKLFAAKDYPGVRFERRERD